MCVLLCLRYFILISADVLNTGVWDVFEDDININSNKYLLGLVSSLKETVLSAKAPSTTDKYSGGWTRWKAFALQFGFQVFPVKHTDLALYIQHLSISSSSIAPIDCAIYSIRWVHNLAGISSPTDNSFIKASLDGFRRLLAKPKVPKEPVSSEILAQLVADKGGSDASILDIRLIFICLVSFAGLLRSNEILSLRMRDISFYHDHMAIKLPKRKNDQLRQGHTVFIARTGNDTCPVSVTERYIAMLGISNVPSHPLVCGFKRSKQSGLKPTDKAISYTTIRDLIKHGLSSYVSDPSAIGTHSLRSGGATEAASAKVNERCLTRQGGWKSTSSKDMYVKDSLSNKLSVTRAMNL